jgi:hypothetical protein
MAYIITCNRILFPPIVDDDDDIIREAKMKNAAKNIRKRKMTFDLQDVEMFSEHDDTRYVQVWFYMNEPIVIEYDYKVMEEQFRKMYEEQENEEDDDYHSHTFWIPAN